MTDVIKKLFELLEELPIPQGAGDVSKNLATREWRLEIHLEKLLGFRRVFDGDFQQVIVHKEFIDDFDNIEDTSAVAVLKNGSAFPLTEPEAKEIVTSLVKSLKKEN